MEVIRNPEQHFNPHETSELIQTINRCIEDKNFYDDLLKQTEADGRRYVFDWEKEWIELMQKITNHKT